MPDVGYQSIIFAVERFKHNQAYKWCSDLFVWVLLRKDYHDKSGHFCVDDVIDIYLNSGLTSLHDRGNRAKYRTRIEKLLTESPLFVHLKDDLYQFRSEKKILIEHQGHARTIKYSIPDYYLKSLTAFQDYCISVFTYNTQYKVETIADRLGLSKRRIQYATKRCSQYGYNNNQIVHKQYRRVLEYFNTLKQAKEFYNYLQIEGIYSSKPFKVDVQGKEFALSVNRSNDYIRFAVLRRYKGRISKRRSTDENKLTDENTQQTKNWYKKTLGRKDDKFVRKFFSKFFDASLHEFGEDYNIDAYIFLNA